MEDVEVISAPSSPSPGSTESTLFNSTEIIREKGETDCEVIGQRMDWMMMMKLNIMNHWIGLKEILQETMVFTIKYRGFL